MGQGVDLVCRADRAQGCGQSSPFQAVRQLLPLLRQKAGEGEAKLQSSKTSRPSQIVGRKICMAPEGWNVTKY